MAGVTEHIIDKEGSIFVFYRCSKCGQNVLLSHKMQEKGKYTTSPGNTNSATDAKRKVAEIDINAKLEKKRVLFIENADKRDYAAMNLKCKCSNCGHSEDWTRYNPAKLEKWMGIVFLLGLLAILGGWMGFVPWPILGFLVSVLIQLGIINAIINGAVNKHVKRMNRKNLPIAAADLDALKQKAALVFPGENLNFQQ